VTDVLESTNSNKARELLVPMLVNEFLVPPRTITYFPPPPRSRDWGERRRENGPLFRQLTLKILAVDSI
jgi:hypothetical protein